MPIYEYRCNNCGFEFEKLESMSAEPERICPDCHKPQAQRLVSAAGFQLKGDGWYLNENRKKPTETKTEEKSNPTAEKSTEKKPESKTE